MNMEYSNSKCVLSGSFWNYLGMSVPPPHLSPLLLQLCLSIHQLGLQLLIGCLG